MKYAENTKKKCQIKTWNTQNTQKNTEYTKNIGSTEYTKYTEEKHIFSTIH